MVAVAFDTHAYVKRLIGAGMPEAQAEVLAEEQVRLLEHRLANKDDIVGVRSEIEALRHELKQDIEALRHELKQDIASIRTEMRELEHRLTLRMGTMLAAAVAIV